MKRTRMWLVLASGMLISVCGCGIDNFWAQVAEVASTTTTEGVVGTALGLITNFLGL